MVELSVLRWFVETARCGSFSLTAEKYRVTPSAVSQGIARLEAELGARLFNRTTRQKNLTTEGLEFLEKVEGGLATIEQALATVGDLKDEPSGRIRLCIPSSFGKSGLLLILADFLQKYPQINLELSFHDGVVDLINQRLDLAIVRESERALHHVTRRLGRNHLILVASPSYLKKWGIPSKPEELSEHEWISARYPSGTRDFELELNEHYLRKSGSAIQNGPRRYKIAHANSLHTGGQHVAKDDEAIVRLRESRITISDQNVTALDAALIGMGIALLTVSLVRRHLHSHELKLVLPEYLVLYESEVFIQYPDRRYLPLRTRKLIDFLIEHFSAEFESPYEPESLLQFSALSDVSKKHDVKSKENNLKAKRK